MSDGPPGNPAQLTLGVVVGRRRPGRVERRTTDACRAARKAGTLGPGDDGLIVLAVELARHIDACAPTAYTPGHPYAAAQVGGILERVHAQLAARAGGTSSDFDRFLASLSAEGSDTTRPGPT